MSGYLNPHFLKPCRFLTALKLRSNVAGNKTSVARATKQMDVICRHCKTQPESLGHILGQCISTKALRIKRHNEIRDFIELESAKTLKVSKESRISDPDNRILQPDLVIQDQGRVFVADVAVCHEDGELLEQGRKNKISKYATLASPLKELTGTSSFDLPIIIDTRGAMPKSTISALKEIGIIKRSLLRTISLIALRSSIEIYHLFMDYNRLPSGIP